MTPSGLKYQVEETGSCFFDRSSMKFFGDTMRNYGVRSTEINGQDVWELFRKNPVKHGLRSSSFFCKKTFKRIRP